MLTACERRLLAFYLANAASGLHHRDREASALAEWVADRENRVACGRKRKRSRLRRMDLDPEEGMSVWTLRRLEEALREEHSTMKKVRADRTRQRLLRLTKTTALTRTDLGILELLLRYQTQPIIESMVDDVFGSTGRNVNPLNLKGRALSVLLDISANTVHRRFRNDAPLVRTGLVSIDSDGDLTIVSRLQRLAQRLLARDRRSLLLFDEMEDLLSEPFPHLAFFGRSFGSRFRDGGSKIFIHRLLDGGGAGAHPVDHERRSAGQPRPSAPHDVRPGAAPADDPGSSPNLGAAARPPRHRGRAGRGPLAGHGVRSHPGRGGRGHRRGPAQRRRHRRRAPWRAQPVKAPVVRKAASRDTGPFRPRTRQCPAVRVHDQFRRASRPGDAAAFRVQGDTRLHDARPGRGGVSRLRRTCAASSPSRPKS